MRRARPQTAFVASKSMAPTRRAVVLFGRAMPFAATVMLALPAAAQADEPLPSWCASPRKSAILDFVKRVIADGGEDVVPVPQRIATFDNDGTLRCEQPIHNQGAFALDRVKALAPEHPDWKTRQPFAAILAGDMKAALASGEKGLLEVVEATHSGMTVTDFSEDRRRLDGHRASSPLQAALYRSRLPAYG